jgi:hypothetical protein
MTPREIVLLLLTLAAALFGATILLARPKFREWQDMRDQKLDIYAQIERDRQLINGRDAWIERLTDLSALLPHFPADARMDNHWLSVMDSLAAKSGVRINQRQAGEEIRMGDVYEMALECKDWEADLESLVRFLFELQSQGAMLDVRNVLIKPKPNGQLRGRFSLSCAYTKAEGGS